MAWRFVQRSRINPATLPRDVLMPLAIQSLRSRNSTSCLVWRRQRIVMTSSNNMRSISGFEELSGLSGSITGLDRTTRSYGTKALNLNFKNSTLKVTFLSKNSALQQSQRFVPASTSSANSHDSHYRSEQENNSLVYVSVLLIKNWT